MAKEIPLTRGKVALVDDEDYEWLNQWKWYCVNAIESGYAARDTWKDGVRTTIYMHRLIMGVSDPKLDIDHIDHVGTHNQRHNLRAVNRASNLHNSKHYKNNKSGYRGVYESKKQRRWQASIRIMGRDRYLGTFDTPEEASAAYQKAAIDYYGE